MENLTPEDQKAAAAIKAKLAQILGIPAEKLKQISNFTKNGDVIREFENVDNALFFGSIHKPDGSFYLFEIQYWQASAEALKNAQSIQQTKPDTWRIVKKRSFEPPSPQEKAVNKKVQEEKAAEAMNLPPVPKNPSQAADLFGEYLLKQYDLASEDFFDINVMDEYLKNLAQVAGHEIVRCFVYSVTIMDDEIRVTLTPKHDHYYDQHIPFIDKYLPNELDNSYEGAWVMACTGEEALEKLVKDLNKKGFVWNVDFQKIMDDSDECDYASKIDAILQSQNTDIKPVSSNYIKEKLVSLGGGKATDYKRLSKFKDAEGSIVREFKNSLSGAFFKAIERDKDVDISKVLDRDLSPSAQRKLGK